MKNLYLVLTILIPNSITFAQPEWQSTFCNPIDINYQYDIDNFKEGRSYRSGADPVVINQGGEYYLFVTNSGGWWHSPDLVHWQFVNPSMWATDDMCAPAVISAHDTLYLFQCTFDRRPIYFSTTPSDGRLQLFNPLLRKMPGEALGPWDPDIFHDEESDKWYMYFGSSNVYPIYGIELDHSKALDYVGEAKKLIYLHPEIHGWERFGQDHRDTLTPFIEGAWMTKHDGKYYLQYGAPGTEYNAYSNGTYVGDHPLGPFSYAPNNPISYKPGGFMAGAGHGNTFQDSYGNFWNTGTPWVAVNWKFERRVAMFPAGFDDDGLMYSTTRFGDFPHYAPKAKRENRNDLFTGWMLLSYRKPCTASSVLDTFSTANVTDENPRTFWVAKENKSGEWLTMDLKNTYEVKAVQVNFTDYQSNVYRRDSSIYTQFRMYLSIDGKQWTKFADLTNEKRDRPNAYIELKEPARARYIKYEHVYTASAHLAISDIRVFGNGDGELPATPSHFKVQREADRRNAFIVWDPVEDVVGYNILWGIGKDKLYETYQVFADRPIPLELRALTVGQDYYFAIETFNEKGVSAVSEVVYVGR